MMMLIIYNRNMYFLNACVTVKAPYEQLIFWENAPMTARRTFFIPKSSIIQDITSCSMAKVNEHFKGTHSLHLQDQKE
jgi:hypothetical protein